MKHQIIPPYGNLEIVCEEGDKEELEEILAKTSHLDHGFLADLLELTGWQANGRLFQLAPEQVGALTDSPILTDAVDCDEDGQVTEVGEVWWFPSYQVESFARSLIDNGRVIFTRAPAV